MIIEGLDAVDKDIVFHAGTKSVNGKVVANGGRVINVVALDKNLYSAIEKAYILADKVIFKNKYFRTDIGSKAFKHYNGEELKS